MGTGGVETLSYGENNEYRYGEVDGGTVDEDETRSRLSRRARERRGMGCRGGHEVRIVGRFVKYEKPVLTVACGRV